jgi:hypothetical protein
MNIQETLLQLDDVALKLAQARKEIMPGPAGSAGLHPNMLDKQLCAASEFLRRASAEVAAAQAELSRIQG